MRFERGLTLLLALLPSLLVGCQSTTPAGGGTGGGGAGHDVARVSLTPSSATIAAGGTQGFEAVATDADGATVETTFVWSSSDGRVASVAGGVATGIAEGTATITATAEGITGNATLTVTPQGGGEGAGAAGAFLLPYTDAAGDVENMRDTVVAVDADGGVHTAYTDLTGDPAVHYYECPSACASNAAFSGGIVAQPSSAPDFLNLVLDPDGHPRLLFTLDQGFAYGACDDDCTDPEAWQFVVLAGTAGLNSGSNRELALDPAGRPRFLYTDDDGSHYGTYYAACDASCMQPGNWTVTPLSTDLFTRPSLTVGSDGLARFTFVAGGGLGYVACADASCDTFDGQIMFPISYLYSDASLRLDAADHPRLALATGPDDPLVLDADTVYYLACDVNCASADDSLWEGVPLVAGQSVYSVVGLELVPSGEPRVALTTEDGVAVAACDRDCAAAAGEWTLTPVESAGELWDEQPVTPPGGCAEMGWAFGAERMGTGLSLALAPGGQPRLGYDVRNVVTCAGHAHTSIQFARFAYLTVP